MSDLDVEIEVCEHLRKVLRTLRSNRGRPELAIPAARWEAKVNERLLEIEKERTRQPQRVAA